MRAAPGGRGRRGGGSGRPIPEPSPPLRLEHQPMEGFLDEAHRPGVGRGLEVLEVVVAVDVDQIVPAAAVFVREPAVPGEPLVEDEALPPSGLRSEGVMAQVLAGLDVVLVRVGPVEPDLLALVGNRVYAPGLYTRLPRKSPSE